MKQQQRVGTSAGTLALSLLLLQAVVTVVSHAAEAPADSPPHQAEDSQRVGHGRLRLGGSFRVRSERFDNFDIRGYDTGDEDHGAYGRLRLQLDYRLDGGPQVFVMLQDSHFWQDKLSRDDFGTSCPYENPLDLRNLFVAWEQIGGTAWGFKIGRQAISYADKHVFGPGDWGNVGRYAWDAAKLTHDSRHLRLEAFYAQRVLFEPEGIDSRHHDFEVWAAYAQLKGIGGAHASGAAGELEAPVQLHLFSLLKRAHGGSLSAGGSSSGEKRTAFGAYGSFTGIGGWDGRGTVAIQRGELDGDDIRTLGYHARLGYTVQLAWPLRLGAEYTHASGDSDPGDGVDETFDNIFGSVDSYYGHMNLFAWKNLQDSQLSLSLRPRSSLRVSLDHHWFQLAEASDAWYHGSGKPQRRDSAGASTRNLGREIDLRAAWQASENVELMAGYSWFFPGTFMRRTARHGQERAEWAFLQVTCRF